MHTEDYVRRFTSGSLDAGIAMNLAGGTHHAFTDHGEGFCVFNDVAVAVRRLQHAGRIARAAIVDLDVELEDGTGADVHERDRLGRLSLSAAGLARRDTLVLRQCREVGLPVVVTVAGGYGRELDVTVGLHVQTARIAARFA